MLEQALSRYRDVLNVKLDALGLRLFIDDDFLRMDAFLEENTSADIPAGPNPTFSPKYNRMTPDRCFWMGLETGAGEIVSTIAAKKFDNIYDFGDRWANLRIHYDDDSKPTPPDQMIVDTRFPDGLEGTISITGRGWTRPDFRRLGLIRNLGVLSRSECLNRWLVDWQIGGTTANHLEHGREAKCFAYNAEENIDRHGYYWKPEGFSSTLRLHVLWIRPDEIIELLEDETKRLLASSTQLTAAE